MSKITDSLRKDFEKIHEDCVVSKVLIDEFDEMWPKDGEAKGAKADTAKVAQAGKQPKNQAAAG